MTAFAFNEVITCEGLCSGCVRYVFGDWSQIRYDFRTPPEHIPNTYRRTSSSKWSFVIKVGQTIQKRQPGFFFTEGCFMFANQFRITATPYCRKLPAVIGLPDKPGQVMTYDVQV